MDNLIDPKSYYDPAIFEVEMEKIFSNCWIFAGLRRDLIKDGDWITTKAGAISITVQNDQGELHALHNICSHRFAVMRTAPKGSGSLKCPYHGWMYDCEGHVSAIPSRPRFQGLDEAKVATMQLRQFTVECCGDFVFVRVNPNGPSLREYCGESWDEMLQYGEAVGPLLHDATYYVSANWKLIMENGIESYHSDCIHPTTFGPSRSHQFKIQNGEHYTRYEEAVTADSNAKWERVKKFFATRPLHTDNYTTFSIFPTFQIDCTRGVNFAIVARYPLSPTETEMRNLIFATRLASPELEQSSFVRAYNEKSRNGAPVIAAEDQQICENVQRGISQARFRSTLSEEEGRLFAFQECYKRYGL